VWSPHKSPTGTGNRRSSENSPPATPVPHRSRLWPWHQPAHWALDRTVPYCGDPSRSRTAHNSRTEYDQLSLLRFFSLGKARGLVPPGATVWAQGRGRVKLRPLRRRSRGERAPVKLGALCPRSGRGHSDLLLYPRYAALTDEDQQRRERACDTPGDDCEPIH